MTVTSARRIVNRYLMIGVAAAIVVCAIVVAPLIGVRDSLPQASCGRTFEIAMYGIDSASPIQGGEWGIDPLYDTSCVEVYAVAVVVAVLAGVVAIAAFGVSLVITLRARRKPRLWGELPPSRPRSGSGRRWGLVLVAAGLALVGAAALIAVFMIAVAPVRGDGEYTPQTWCGRTYQIAVSGGYSVGSENGPFSDGDYGVDPDYQVSCAEAFTGAVFWVASAVVVAALAFGGATLVVVRILRRSGSDNDGTSSGVMLSVLEDAPTAIPVVHANGVEVPVAMYEWTLNGVYEEQVFSRPEDVPVQDVEVVDGTIEFSISSGVRPADLEITLYRELDEHGIPLLTMGRDIDCLTDGGCAFEAHGDASTFTVRTGDALFAVLQASYLLLPSGDGDAVGTGGIGAASWVMRVASGTQDES